eukprot:610393-Amphidinium_carterae.1
MGSFQTCTCKAHKGYGTAAHRVPWCKINSPSQTHGYVKALARDIEGLHPLRTLPSDWRLQACSGGRAGFWHFSLRAQFWPWHRIGSLANMNEESVHPVSLFVQQCEFGSSNCAEITIPFTSTAAPPNRSGQLKKGKGPIISSPPVDLHIASIIDFIRLTHCSLFGTAGAHYFKLLCCGHAHFVTPYWIIQLRETESRRY